MAASSRKPALIDHKPSPSITALTSILAFQNAIRKEYGKYFSDEEKELVDRMVENAIANEPDFFMWLKEKGLNYSPYRFQRSALDWYFAPAYVQQKLARKLMIKTFIEDRIYNRNLEQVVFLGGGYDTRGYILSRQFPALKIFELDLGVTRSIKLKGLPKGKEISPDHVILNDNYHLLKCDLMADNMKAILESAGFEKGLPSVFVGEGVSMYLSAEGNKRLLASLAGLSTPTSEILLSYRSSTQNQAMGAALQASTNESYTFALAPENVIDFALEHKFNVSAKMLYSDMLNWVRSETQDTQPGAAREHYYKLEPETVLTTTQEEDIFKLPLITDNLLFVKPERVSFCALI